MQVVKRNMLIMVLTLCLLFAMGSTAFAITVDAIPDNSLRVGKDFYSFSSNNYKMNNILTSMGTGSELYYKFGGMWFDLSTVQSAMDLFNPSKAINQETVNSWQNLGNYYGDGADVQQLNSGSSDDFVVVDIY